MKKYITVIVFCFSVICCKDSKIKSKNDLESLFLKGKVKEMTQEYYLAVESYGDVNTGILELTSGDNYKIKFNLNGNKIEDIKVEKDPYKDSKEQVYKTTYKYDANERLTEESRFIFDNILVSKIKYKYDSLPQNQQMYRCIKKYYNPQGTLNNGVLTSMDSIEYNSVGKEISLKSFDPKNLTGKLIYEYDKDGNRIEIIGYDYPRDRIIKQLLKYDSKGNPIQQRHILINATYKDTIHNAIYNSVFDNSNNEVGRDKTLRFEYEYDKIGNWIKKVENFKDSAKFITKRKFEYYTE